MIFRSPIGVYERHPAVLTMIPTADGIQWRHRGHPAVTSLFPILTYAASASAWARAKGKANDSPVLAVVCFAPDLRGESTSACSVRPICPVETSHPHFDLIIAPGPISSKLSPKLWLPFLIPVLDRSLEVPIHVAFCNCVSLVVETLAPRQGNLNLSTSFLQVDPKRYNRPAALIDLALEPPYLLAME
jgi:hypothetical protein